MKGHTIHIKPEINKQEFFQIAKRSVIYQVKTTLSSKLQLSSLSLGILYIAVFREVPLSFVLLVIAYLTLSVLPSIFLLGHYKLGVIKKLINNELTEREKILVFEVLYETIVFPFESKIKNPPTSKFDKVAKFLFSFKTQKEIFEPIIADWQDEYFEALIKKDIWKTRWINVRYTYAFLAAMWQKSPIGDLVEFVIKIAKQ